MFKYCDESHFPVGVIRSPLFSSVHDVVNVIPTGKTNISMAKKGTSASRAVVVAVCFTLVSCLAYSSTLKMETKCSSKTSLDFQQCTQLYIPEDRTLQLERCSSTAKIAYKHGLGALTTGCTRQ
jgi:hypothetical protein